MKLPDSHTRRVPDADPNDELRRVLEAAQRLKTAYTAAMRHALSICAGHPVAYSPSPIWDGDKVPPRGPEARKPRQSVWMKVAAQLLREDIDPAAYVTMVFRQLPDKVRQPHPNQLLSASYRQAYVLALQAVVPELAAAFRSQKLQAETQIQLECARTGNGWDAWKRVVVASSRYSPLFRYCFLWSVLRRLTGPPANIKTSWFHDQVAVLRPEARQEYRQHPVAYDAAWGDALPEDLTEDDRAKV